MVNERVESSQISKDTTEVDEYKQRILKYFSPINCLANQHLSYLDEFGKSVIESVSNTKDGPDTNLLTKLAKLESTIDNEVRTAGEEVEVLKTEVEAMLTTNAKLKNKLKQLKTKAAEEEKVIKGKQQLCKVYETLTGVKFIASKNNLEGFVFNSDKSIIKSFSGREGDIRAEEKLWMLIKEFLEGTF